MREYFGRTRVMSVVEALARYEDAEKECILKGPTMTGGIMAELCGGASRVEQVNTLCNRVVYNEDSALWYRHGENQIVNDGVAAGSYAEAFEKLYGQ